MGRPTGRRRDISAEDLSPGADDIPAAAVSSEAVSSEVVSSEVDVDDEQRDQIAVRFFSLGERWTAEVTLGSTMHELGSFTTASKAMNAAMKFYYEQRPAAKRRQYE
jgi:hypothetical protein